MNRFIYWMKRFISKKDYHCRSFCPACPYFENCKQDPPEENNRK